MTNARPEQVGTGVVTSVPKGHDHDSCDPPSQASASDLLRQLSRGLLDGPHGEAPQRLADAAAQAANWVGRGLVGRTAAATVLSVAAQAAGIGQDDALATIRDAFRKGGDR